MAIFHEIMGVVRWGLLALAVAYGLYHAGFNIGQGIVTGCCISARPTQIQIQKAPGPKA